MRSKPSSTLFHRALAAHMLNAASSLDSQEPHLISISTIYSICRFAVTSVVLLLAFLSLIHLAGLASQ